MAITPSVLHDHIETDLADTTLQQIIDQSYASLIEIAGPATEITKDMTAWQTRRLHLVRPAAAITSIQEGVGVDSLSVVDASSYSLIPGGYVIERHGQAWSYYVRVTYTPVQNLALRESVVIDLCKLEIQYKGIVSEDAGDYSATHPDYVRERNRILSRMLTTTRVIA